MKFRLILLLAAMTVGSAPVYADKMTPSDCTSEKYLIDHGHSPEIVRMINLQKSRTEGTPATVKSSPNKIVKFWKNLWIEQDITMPLTDFGDSSVTTVETKKALGEEKIKNLSEKKFKFHKKKKEQNNEIYINEIR